MRVVLLPPLAALSLIACGERTEAPDPIPVYISIQTDTAQSSPATTVEQTCREAARILFGQEGGAVSFDEATFDISWPAPVDGGRLIFACSHVGNEVSLSRDGERQTVNVSAPANGSTQGETR